MTAAETYTAMMDVASAQRARIHGERTPGERWNENTNARRLRSDPHRALNVNMQTLSGYIEPGDLVLDVGGGAGRIGLPLALQCRELINVDPSPAMLAEFKDCAAEAGIHNIRAIQGDWLEIEDITADVVLAAHVTYFVRDIVPFIQKLHSAARRRVIIDVSSFANTNRTDKLFRLVYGEEQATVPAHKELMAVIWELGMLPDVKVLPLPSRVEPNPTSREEAIEQALHGSWFAPGDRDRAARVIESHFDELFAFEKDVILPLWRPQGQEVLITWETGAREQL